jgi:hypothetical protein
VRVSVKICWTRGAVNGPISSPFCVLRFACAPTESSTQGISNRTRRLDQKSSEFYLEIRFEFSFSAYVAYIFALSSYVVFSCLVIKFRTSQRQAQYVGHSSELYAHFAYKSCYYCHMLSHLITSRHILCRLCAKRDDALCREPNAHACEL